MPQLETKQITTEVSPLVCSDDVGHIADWAVKTRGLTESWRAIADSGIVEHPELTWPGG